MSWTRLLSTRRLNSGDSGPGRRKGRSEFDADIDRIAFTSSFRRLSGKTQVHPLVTNDNVHTRLTHSIEVSLVGRTLGQWVGKDIEKEHSGRIRASDVGAVVEAACLAHDLGNPPFGHAGERAINTWLQNHGEDLFRDCSDEERRDLMAFEGNAQGFRMITSTENHGHEGGLRLTCATYGAFLKYPWLAGDGISKFSAFLSEKRLLDEVGEHLGMARAGRDRWSRHPLALLLEAADDICYAFLDLEDAVELSLLECGEVERVFLDIFDDATEAKQLECELAAARSSGTRLARLRGPVFERAIEGAVSGFKRAYGEIMAGTLRGGLFDALDAADPVRRTIEGAKATAKERVYPSQRKIELELGSRTVLTTLLGTFCRAAVERARNLRRSGDNVAAGEDAEVELAMELMGDRAPDRHNAPYGAEWTEYECARNAIDFVAGMTDSYATYVARQIQEKGRAEVS